MLIQFQNINLMFQTDVYKSTIYNNNIMDLNYNISVLVYNNLTKDF